MGLVVGKDPSQRSGMQKQQIIQRGIDRLVHISSTKQAEIKSPAYSFSWTMGGIQGISEIADFEVYLYINRQLLKKLLRPFPYRFVHLRDIF